MRGSHGRLGSNWQDPWRAIVLEEEEEKEKETLQHEGAQVLSARRVLLVAAVSCRVGLVLVVVRLTNLGPIKHLELSSNAAT